MSLSGSSIQFQSLNDGTTGSVPLVLSKPILPFLNIIVISEIEMYRLCVVSLVWEFVALWNHFQSKHIFKRAEIQY